MGGAGSTSVGLGGAGDDDPRRRELGQPPRDRRVGQLEAALGAALTAVGTAAYYVVARLLEVHAEQSATEQSALEEA